MRIDIRYTRRDLHVFVMTTDAPARPSFRSTLSQPSQMGNFRHQSIRTTERDRDRDAERERQRDERDREGQERLRNVRSSIFDGLHLSTMAHSFRISMIATVLEQAQALPCATKTEILHLT